MDTTTNYFIELEKVVCEVEKKGKLNYISWSDGWTALKRIHPEATYEKIKNGNTYLFPSGKWGSVECSVTVAGITHTADLAVTDTINKGIAIDAISSTDIQNTLQRAFAKAIAMHGIWLYVYRWEDFPEDDNDNIKKQTVPTKSTPNGWSAPAWFNKKELEMCIAEDNAYSKEAIEQWALDNGYKLSWPSRILIDKYLNTGEL